MTSTNIQVIEMQGMRVLTTAQLAECYETTTKIISQNFKRNSDRYEEGKHYICLKGDELRAFRANLQIEDLPKNLNVLYLWTERGALLHAKSLNTDKAWEVYDFLVEHYFRAVTMEDLVDMTADQMFENAKAYNKNRKRITELRKYHELQFDADVARAKAALAQIKLLDYLEQHQELSEVVNVPMLEKK